eukprot:scaffold144430_cov39-Prasinocladus_malaysianus.AAC.1
MESGAGSDIISRGDRVVNDEPAAHSSFEVLGTGREIPTPTTAAPLTSHQCMSPQYSLLSMTPFQLHCLDNVWPPAFCVEYNLVYVTSLRTIAATDRGPTMNVSSCRALDRLGHGVVLWHAGNLMVTKIFAEISTIL